MQCVRSKYVGPLPSPFCRFADFYQGPALICRWPSSSSSARPSWRWRNPASSSAHWSSLSPRRWLAPSSWPPPSSPPCAFSIHAGSSPDARPVKSSQPSRPRSGRLTQPRTSSCLGGRKRRDRREAQLAETAGGHLLLIPGISAPASPAALARCDCGHRTCKLLYLLNKLGVTNHLFSPVTLCSSRHALVQTPQNTYTVWVF